MLARYKGMRTPKIVQPVIVQPKDVLTCELSELSQTNPTGLYFLFRDSEKPKEELVRELLDRHDAEYENWLEDGGLFEDVQTMEVDDLPFEAMLRTIRLMEAMLRHWVKQPSPFSEPADWLNILQLTDLFFVLRHIVE